MRRAPRAATLVAAVCFVVMSTLVATADTPPTNPSSTDMVNGPVRAIVQTGNDLWIGGAFTQVVDEKENPIQTAGGLAAFTDSGQLDTSLDLPVFTKSSGTAIIQGLSVGPNGNLYAAGSFDAVNGVHRQNVAEIDPSTGHLLPWSPHAISAFSILATNSAIYVGGNKLQAFDLSGGATPGWRPPQLAINDSLRGHVTDPNVRRIVQVGDTLIIACQCDSITDAHGTHGTKAVAEIDADSGDWINWAPSNLAASSSAFGIDEIVQNMPGSGKPTLFLAAGGNDFTAAYDLATGHLDWSTDTSGSSQAIDWFQGTLIIGGHFDWTHAPGASDCGDHEHPNTQCYLSPHLVAMSPTTGAIVLQGGDPWNPGICCLYNGVWALLADSNGTTLHVGGEFTKAGTATWSYNAGSHTYAMSGGSKQEYYARFDAPVGPQTLDVDVAGSGNGDVTSKPVGIDCPGTCASTFGGNASVTLTAKASAGSTFAGWSGDCTGTDACTLLMNAARSVTATFSTTVPSRLTVTDAGAGTGTVTSTPARIDCGTKCTATFPDGTLVTLTASPAAGSTFDGWSGDCTGTDACQVTMSDDHDVTATFGREATACGKVLFVSNRTGNDDIFAKDPGGGGLVNLTHNPARDSAPAWSGNCKEIAFVSTRDGDTSHVFEMKANGGGVAQVTKGKADDIQPTWAPDGTELAFVSDRSGTQQLYTIDADGKGVQRITRNTWDDVQPDWSPDGDTIVFASNRFGTMQLFTIAADGSHRTRITDGARASIQPTWSPNGTRIAFVSRASGTQQIWTMTAAGTGLHQVTKDGATDGHPSWAPQGHRLAYSSTKTGNSEIWLIGARGVGPVRFTADPSEDSAPAWR